MIGRNTRKRVVYVDGIPIESNLLEAGESGLKGIEKYNPASVSTQDPRALFDKYDADASGDIDFDEFNVLLKDLSINLAEPKARAYFKRCDRRRRGCISFEEFRLTLYTCDPKHPNRTGGFAPGQSLAPKDLFEMFDRDEEGVIDREVFGELLEFIGKKMPLDKMEGVFGAYEDPELEAMPYIQFKKAWLSIVNVQAELRQRGERFNRFLPPAMLAKRLSMIVNLEEKQEARTLLEVNNALSDEDIIVQRRELVKEAQFLARVTLAEALDAAGQVYVFGKGANQRFDSEPREPDFVEFMGYGAIHDLSLSLYIRGVELAKPMRMILIETIGECLELELECVGTKFHEHFKQQDQIARRYRRERRERALAFLTFKTTALWFDLAQLREKMVNAENERIMKGDEEYDDMKRKITRSTQKLKRRAREGYEDAVVTAGNGLVEGAST
ncbi:hypothetical protein BBJ29_007360 [Phytophthora kernoviae]|uniref:EF-hand domain-containing protein n=1 Tax=Phytophthora kernoviae TaxID=325452 RepID=A0A3F2RSA9_9STRA|nr:hypothetical protein BBJ29_007360 [Phytophthora kernoviae]RLN63260.1 hypothetical protein BBP00_00004252 [Phytophthora kernoviae]